MGIWRRPGKYRSALRRKLTPAARMATVLPEIGVHLENVG